MLYDVYKDDLISGVNAIIPEPVKYVTRGKHSVLGADKEPDTPPLGRISAKLEELFRSMRL